MSGHSACLIRENAAKGNLEQERIWKENRQDLEKGVSWKKEIKYIVSVKYRKRGREKYEKNSKKNFSGVLSALTILTSVVQPMTAYAGETNPKSYEMEYPALEQVKAQLQKDEIVTVQDYEVEKGNDFDKKTDFSGMKFHSDQVKVTFL